MADADEHRHKLQASRDANDREVEQGYRRAADQRLADGRQAIALNRQDRKEHRRDRQHKCRGDEQPAAAKIVAVDAHVFGQQKVEDPVAVVGSGNHPRSVTEAGVGVPR